MKKILISLIVVAFIFGMSGEAWAVFWADSIYGFNDSGNGFGGGIDKNGNGYYEWWRGDKILSGVNPAVALGKPDESFISILPGEYIIVEFSLPFINGGGNDFFVAETGHAGEIADISVSFDGVDFTLLGDATVPPDSYTYDPNATAFGDYYWFDLASFTGPAVYYVKITGVKACGASDGFDLAGIGAEYPPAHTPEPASLLLLGSGLIGVALLGVARRRKITV